jgi:small subunit ribosomal protein S13
MIIFEHNLPENKRLDISLKSCLGFGFVNSKLLLSKTGLNLNNNKISKLKKKIFSNLDFLINNRTVNLLKLCVGVDRKNKSLLELKKLRESNTFRALRHYQRLPTRGQRTKTNAMTQKSKRGIRRNLPIAAKKKI